MLKVVIHRTEKPEGEVKYSLTIGEALPIPVDALHAAHIIEVNGMSEDTVNFPNGMITKVYSA